MIKNEKKRDSFVVYASWLETIENLEAFGVPKETIRELEHNLLYYGFTENFDTDDQSIISQVDSLVSKQMAASTARYTAAVNGGKKGGAKQTQLDMPFIHELKEKGLTNIEIAKILKDECGVEVSGETVRRRYKDWYETNKEYIEASKNF